MLIYIRKMADRYDTNDRYFEPILRSWVSFFQFGLDTVYKVAHWNTVISVSRVSVSVVHNEPIRLRPDTEKNILDINNYGMERTIRMIMELTNDTDIIKNDRLCEAISVVLQELHTIMEAKRRYKNEVIYPKEEEEKCPCGDCP